MSDSIQNTVIPKASLKRCYFCEKLLTVPPIRSVSLESEDYQCGRCENVTITRYTRITLFENVAVHMLFPCTYDGCTRNIPWSQVKSHEKECAFRTIQCPVYYQQCEEIIQVEKIKEHFQRNHPHNIKQYKEAWSLNNRDDYIFLMTVQGVHFLVYVLHTNGRHAISVFSTSAAASKFTKYDVRMSSRSEFVMIFENGKILCYDENQHCYKCIYGTCTAKHHPYANRSSEMNLDEFTHLNNRLTEELICSDIKYTINLLEDDAQTSVPEGNSQAAEDASHVLKEQMVCPICQLYLIAPIFVCRLGHTVCNLCRPRLRACPTCKAELGSSRNYHLEGITEMINLPCEYKNRGCTYSGNTEKIAKHEFDCPYST